MIRLDVDDAIPGLRFHVRAWVMNPEPRRLAASYGVHSSSWAEVNQCLADQIGLHRRVRRLGLLQPEAVQP